MITRWFCQGELCICHSFFFLAEKPGFELGLIVTICVYLFNLVTNLLLFVQDAPNSSIW